MRESERTQPNTRTALLAAAISGVLYFLLVLVPQVDGPPVESATAADIRTFLSNNDTGLRALAAGTVLAIPLVLVFTTSLARLIRTRAPGSQLADLVTAGGVLVAAWHWIVTASASTTLVQNLDGYDLARVDDATLRGWYGLTNFGHFFADLGMCGIATVIGATSIAALRTGLLSRWIAWLGLVLAVGGAIGTLGIAIAWVPLSYVWFVGIFGWWIWILIVAISCARQARRSKSRSPVGQESPPSEAGAGLLDG